MGVRTTGGVEARPRARERRMTVTVLMAAGITASCSDGGSDGGSSVNGDKPLLQVTAEENQKLCRFRERRSKAALGSEEEYCTAEALFAVESVARCEADRDACVESESYENAIDEDWRCESEVAFYVSEGECTATVAELEACIEEDTEQWEELTDFSCEEAAEVEYPVGLGPACQRLNEVCPGIKL